jgi:hypothetical protein
MVEIEMDFISIPTNITERKVAKLQSRVRKTELFLEIISIPSNINER